MENKKKTLHFILFFFEKSKIVLIFKRNSNDQWQEKKSLSEFVKYSIILGKVPKTKRKISHNEKFRKFFFISETTHTQKRQNI